MSIHTPVSACRAILFAALPSIIALPSHAGESPLLEWTIGQGGSQLDEGIVAVHDGFGGMFSAGAFRPNADFDPGAPVFELDLDAAAGLYIQRVDELGDLLWAVVAPQNNGEEIGLYRDSAGGIYNFGSYTHLADFDPGPSVLTVPGDGSPDAFVQKLDSNGNLVWLAAIAGTSNNASRALDVAVGQTGDVFVVGDFRGANDFDPGPGVSSLVASDNGYDAYVQKLDDNGNLEWVTSFGGFSHELAKKVGVDRFGNLLVSGMFHGNLQWSSIEGGIELENLGSSDAFVMKLNATGQPLWAGSIGGSLEEYLTDMAVDASGNSYTAVLFQGEVVSDFPLGAASLNSNGGFDAAILKVGPCGEILWSASIGGAGDDGIVSVSVDHNGGVYLCGYFQETVDFDPGLAEHEITSTGDYDAFVAKLDANGQLLWVNTFGGSGLDSASGMDVDAAGNIYLTGQFSNTVDFDPGAGTANLTSAGNVDIFQVKLSQPEFEGPSEGEGESAEEEAPCEGDTTEGEANAAAARLTLLALPGLDFNQDGKLDESEYAGMQSGSPEDFDALDLNGDGSLSRAELLRQIPEARPLHNADINGDGDISISELLRLIQLYNAGGYDCAADPDDTEDGYLPDGDAKLSSGCPAHAADYLNGDGVIDLTELLRLIQLYNLGGISPCETSEDGFCAVES